MPKPPKKNTPRTTPGHIRIIGGLHRGRKLPVLVHEGLRPTTDRVRETLFNWLMFHIRDTKVLDMFAGSGALGFEAYSRGAKHVTMIELDRQITDNLNKCRTALGAPEAIRLINGNSLDQVKRHNEKFDIIFLDPPFRHDILTAAIPLLETYAVHEGTLIYLEQEIEHQAKVPASFKLLKDGKAGQVCYRLYRYETIAKDN